MCAAVNGQLDRLRILKKIGANVNYTDSKLYAPTPLAAAVEGYKLSRDQLTETPMSRPRREYLMQRKADFGKAIILLYNWDANFDALSKSRRILAREVLADREWAPG